MHDAGPAPPSAPLDPRAPNFFVVGAPKAGTTSLYWYLDQHPSVFMSPIKEPAFFAPEVVDFTPTSRQDYDADAPALREYLDGPMETRRSRGIVLNWPDYLKLFRNAGAARARGEVSGNYLASSGAAAAIRRMIPHARIIMILRNPADRLFSQYASAVSAGDARGSFHEWITVHERAESARTPRFGPIWTGMYAAHLRRYRTSFPAEQIQVHLYEDYCARPEAVLADAFRFLEVDASDRIDTGRRHNVTTVPRWPTLDRGLRALKPMLTAALPTRLQARARAWYRRPPVQRPTADDRARLLSIYREDISELQDMLGRDLSSWLRSDTTRITG